jgi:hypothetical protein
MSWTITPRFTQWTPADISTALWLDAADATTVQATGGVVDQWSDKSGNARNVVATLTARPANIATQNSKTVLSFDGSNDKMTRSGGVITGSTSRTVYAVAKPLNGNAALDFGADSSLSRYSVSLNTGFIGVNGSNIAWSTINGNTFGIYVFSQAGSSLSTITAFWNGTSYVSTSSTSATSPLSTATTSTTVGCDVSQSTFFQGDIAEIVVLGQASEADTRQRIEGYLAHKWGLTANLPANHPYKVNPPAP